MAIIHAQDSKISGLISGLDKTFIIPPFQRNYCWGEDNAETFFNDMLVSKKSGKPHYFGNIISYEGKSGGAYQERILVDGQQRITTVLLYILATTKYLKNETYIANYRNNYLLNNILEGNRIRLKQTSGDQDVFEKLIEGNELSDIEKKSNINVIYEYFLALLKGKDDNELIGLVDVICNFEIADISIIANNDMRVIQEIFEKINSAGKELTSGDLIRNYLLIHTDANEQENLYKTYWVNIENNCKNVTELAKCYYTICSLKNDLEEKKIL